MHRHSTSTAVLILLLALAPPARSQDELPTFGEAVEVNVVNLSVYVTRDGEPVTDLPRDDFEVFEEGERVPLTNFYAFQPRPGHARPSAERSDAAAPAAETGAPPEAESLRVPDPLFVVAYVDNMNLRPHSRKMVLERLETFVGEQLAPEDQVMIVTAGHRLQIRQEPSHDRELTRRTLAKLTREPALGVQEDQELSRILNEVAHRYTDALAGELDAERIAIDFRNQEERLIGQARGSFGMLGDLVGSLGELEGRKMVIHVSDGISAAANRAELGQLLARANANQVSFYTIDGGGSRQFAPSMAGQPGNLGDFWTPDMARRRQDDREQSIHELATGTGGKMMLARKNMDRELDGFRDAVAHYYSLGFAPRAGGGEVRQIRVKVRRKGLQVRYPKSYRLKTPEEKLYERVLTALRLGVADNELELKLDFGGASLAEGAVVLPMLVRLPIDRLVLIPHEGRRVGSVTLMYGVLDGAGRASEIRLGNLPISVEEERLAEVAGKEAGYEVLVALAPTARRVAVAARDDIGRTMAAIKRDIKLVDGAAMP
jgi:VWFA-related protein